MGLGFSGSLGLGMGWMMALFHCFGSFPSSQERLYKWSSLPRNDGELRDRISNVMPSCPGADFFRLESALHSSSEVKGLSESAFILVNLDRLVTLEVLSFSCSLRTSGGS